MEIHKYQNITYLKWWVNRDPFTKDTVHIEEYRNYG